MAPPAPRPRAARRRRPRATPQRRALARRPPPRALALGAVGLQQDARELELGRPRPAPARWARASSSRCASSSRAGTRAPSARSAKLGLQPVAAGRPAVLLDAPRRVRRRQVARVVALRQPARPGVDERGHRGGVGHRGLGVGNPQLERPVPRCGRSSHHQRPAVGSAPAARAPPQRLGERVPARDRGRHALAGQQVAELRAHRGQARVAPGVERRVRRQRGELGQVRAQRVVDRERPVVAADRDVHLQGARPAAARRPRRTRARARRSARRRVELARAAPRTDARRRRRAADPVGGARPASRRAADSAAAPPPPCAAGGSTISSCAAGSSSLKRGSPPQRVDHVGRPRRAGPATAGVEQHQLLLQADRQRRRRRRRSRAGVRRRASGRQRSGSWASCGSCGSRACSSREATPGCSPRICGAGPRSRGRSLMLYRIRCAGGRGSAGRGHFGDRRRRLAARARQRAAQRPPQRRPGAHAARQPARRGAGRALRHDRQQPAVPALERGTVPRAGAARTSTAGPTAGRCSTG